jgi:hypothetical protein
MIRSAAVLASSAVSWGRSRSSTCKSCESLQVGWPLQLQVLGGAWSYLEFRSRPLAFVGGDVVATAALDPLRLGTGLFVGGDGGTSNPPAPRPVAVTRPLPRDRRPPAFVDGLGHFLLGPGGSLGGTHERIALVVLVAPVGRVWPAVVPLITTRRVRHPAVEVNVDGVGAVAVAGRTPLRPGGRASPHTDRPLRADCSHGWPLDAPAPAGGDTWTPGAARGPCRTGTSLAASPLAQAQHGPLSTRVLASASHPFRAPSPGCSV